VANQEHEEGESSGNEAEAEVEDEQGKSKLMRKWPIIGDDDVDDEESEGVANRGYEEVEVTRDEQGNLGSGDAGDEEV
jgi:hypothetical protein